MFERFTANARCAVLVAKDEARRLGHPYVGTEHLAAALVQVRGSNARELLRRLGVEPERLVLRRRLTRSVEIHRAMGGMATAPEGWWALTPETQRVCVQASSYAARCGAGLVGTGHLLLALAMVRHGHASGELRALGVTPERLGLLLGMTIRRTALWPSDALSRYEVSSYTQAALFAQVAARNLAQRLDHPTAETAHLLLSLVVMREAGSRRLLRRLGVDALEVANRIADLFAAPSYASAGDGRSRSASLRRALELGVESARARRSATVSTSHLLLGVAREARGDAGRILRRLGVTRDRLEEELVRGDPLDD